MTHVQDDIRRSYTNVLSFFVFSVRKRSPDAPPHDYIHFAGKHIHEIEIANLGELLQHEQDQ